ncbi:MAG: SLC13 family permease, partial [Thermoanaerobaculum sp.]|nr:SLC13 family permease [Thermoanaerobaculum sp.]
ALAVAKCYASTASGKKGPYATFLLLTIAYAASIGGVATPVGTPPNLLAIGQLEKLTGVRITFFQWMVLGLPVGLLMLVVCLCHLGRSSGEPWEKPAELAEELRRLGPVTRRQRNVLAAFTLAVFLWIVPGLVGLVAGDRSWGQLLARLFPESVVALLAASLLFVLPVDGLKGASTLQWHEASRLDWGTLLLFGGGLSLGTQLFKSGLAGEFGSALVAWTGATDTMSLTYLLGIVGLLLTETTSNTAAATVLCPLAIAAAQTAGVSPIPPAVAVAMGCSMAFMLPVATPSNAIVYGSGLLGLTAMVRHGLVMNLAGALLIPLLVVALCRLLGLS